jgi:hypothetical protein
MKTSNANSPTAGFSYLPKHAAFARKKRSPRGAALAGRVRALPQSMETCFLRALVILGRFGV